MVAAAWSDSILWHSVGAVLLATFVAWVAAVSAGASATLSGMDTTTAHGYMVEAEWDGRQLRARGTNKASQVALAGQDHAAGDVVIPAGEIASARLKPASMMTNGNLIVRTVDGRKVQLHFRRKQADDFQALYEAMLPFLPVDEPAESDA